MTLHVGYDSYMTFYRVQQPEHSLEWLLDPEMQFSSPWWSDDESLIRRGVSCCSSIEALAAYFAESGVPLPPDARLVALDGYYSPDDPIDAHAGECLVIPTEIISAAPIPDEFYLLVAESVGDAW